MLEELQEILKYRFKNPALLRQALTHSSHTTDVSQNYERLEFLGDRVLGLSIAALLYKIFPQEPEGSLSQRFGSLVCKETVAQMAQTLHLDKFMIVANEDIRHNENVLCDVCEAVIGAIFIDAGDEEAINFVDTHWKELIDRNIEPPKDAKTKLQEVTHAKNLPQPEYVVLSREGSEHEPIFHIAVKIGKLPPAIGSGRNKKLAQQEAAAQMLERLK